MIGRSKQEGKFIYRHRERKEVVIGDVIFQRRDLSLVRGEPKGEKLRTCGPDLSQAGEKLAKCAKACLREDRKKKMTPGERNHVSQNRTEWKKKCLKEGFCPYATIGQERIEERSVGEKREEVTGES